MQRHSVLLFSLIVAAYAGQALGDRPAGDTQSLEIVINGPADTAAAGPVEIQIRVFEAEDPDAPPQVSNIALQTVRAEKLTLPMAVEVQVPVARLAGALRPAVGALVLSGGRMVYWNNEMIALDRTGPTIVELSAVP